MLKTTIRLILFLIVTLPSLSHGFVCSDDEGNLTYQDELCPLPPSDPDLAPIRASEVTEENTTQTVTMFRAAFLAKDVEAIGRLTHEKFRFLSVDGQNPDKVLFDLNKSAFLQMGREQFPATRGAAQEIHSTATKLREGVATVSSRITESMYFGHEKISQTVAEQIKIQVFEGRVLISSIRQQEL